MPAINDSLHWIRLRLKAPRRQVVFVMALSFVWVSVAAANKEQGVYTENGVALAGYDTVAYFTMSQAVKGKSQYTVEWQNVTWLFANQHHANLFRAAPEKYAPKFGGFCALGVSYGERMRPDMTAWEIHDGQLYLYYDPPTKVEWSEDRDAHEKAAVEKWKTMQTPATSD